MYSYIINKKIFDIWYGRRKSITTSGVRFFYKSSLKILFTRGLAYVRINIPPNSCNVYTAENQEERLFQRDSIRILVSRTVKTRKSKLLYFRNETCYGIGNLYKDLLFVYLQPSVNKNWWNLAILTLQFDNVTVKPFIFTLANIYCNYPLTTTQDDGFTRLRTSLLGPRPRAPLGHPLSHFLALYPSYSGLLIKSWSIVQIH